VTGNAATVLIALASTTMNALGTATQQRATQRAPSVPGLHVRLVLLLARQRLWWAGHAGTLVGFGLYLTALATGPLTLVQPIMVLGLVLGSSFGAVLARRPVDRYLIAGGATCAGGLALLLGVARPVPGVGAPVVAPAWVLTAAVVVAVVAVVVGARTAGLTSAVAFASATGVFYGVNAALLKLLADDLNRGVLATVARWPLYAALVVGPTGLLVAQRALQVGRLLAPVNAVISTVDPVTATALAVLVLGERLASTPTAVLGEAAGAFVVVLGVVVTLRRSGRLLGDPGVAGWG
jgi:drug/metabolite transporter (DMT)-like permease